MADDSTTTIRTCTKCGAEKPATFEHFDNYRCRGKVLQRRFCRECLNARTKAYRADNSDKVAVWEKRNYERNKGAGSEYAKRRYALKDKAKAREDLDRWKAENPEKARAIEVARNDRIRAQRKADPEVREKLNKKSREWRAEKRRSDPAFRGKCNAATREWHAENKDRQNAYKRELNARRRETDLSFKIACNLRSRLNVAVRRGYKSGSAVEMLGCSVDEFRRYIEQKFQHGMSWDNWGRGWNGRQEWHLDHITPISSFDLSDPAQTAMACHYTNLQPLWSKENLSKGASHVVSYSGGSQG